MLPCTDDGGSISELKDYIHSIRDKLKKLSEVQDPPLTVNYWMKHARELSYDIEAYLDGLDAQTENSLNDSDAKEGDDPDDSYAKMKDCIDNSDDETEYSVDYSHAEMEDNPDDSDANMEDPIDDDSDDETEETVDNSDSSRWPRSIAWLCRGVGGHDLMLRHRGSRRFAWPPSRCLCYGSYLVVG